MGKRKTSGCSANTRDTAQFYACKLPPHRIPAASIQRRQQTCLRLELDNECRGSAESNWPRPIPAAHIAVRSRQEWGWFVPPGV